MDGTHCYTRDSFLEEFFPDADDRREVEAGTDRMIATNRAYRLAEIRRRLGLTHMDVSRS